MKQRFCFGRIVEVAALFPQNEIRDEAGSSGQMGAELLVFVGQQQKPARCQSGDQDHNQSGKDAPDAAGVKLDKTKAACFQAAEQNGRNQESRDDEKDIDPNEAAVDQFSKRMESNNGKDCHRTKSVNIGAILGMSQMPGTI